MNEGCFEQEHDCVTHNNSVLHVYYLWYSNLSIFGTFLWFLSPLVLSVSAKAWKTATDAPNVTILSTMWINFTQTFLVGINDYTQFTFLEPACYQPLRKVQSSCAGLRFGLGTSLSRGQIWLFEAVLLWTCSGVLDHPPVISTSTEFQQAYRYSHIILEKFWYTFYGRCRAVCSLQTVYF